MMDNKIAILTDTTSSVQYSNHTYDNIFVLPHTVIFGSEEYVDGVDITNDEFFRRIVEEDVIPSTSQPSIGQTIEICEEIKRQGYTDIIYLPISKGISSTYNSIVGSIDLIEGINFKVVDTKATAVHLGFMALEAARLTKENTSVEEIITYVEHLRDNLHIYFMVDDLKYLIKNGRLSNAAGFLGSLLKIKPVLEFDDEGRIIGTEKIRTTKRTMETIVNHVIEATKDCKKVQYTVCHGFDMELLAKFKEELKRITDLENFLILPLPSVIGAHVGNGVVSVGYFIIEE
ncbi:DegV family protein [Mycoplasmatota bacterium]|nr:DegV family protein [Mycoplasmatota bacterium]